MASLAVRQDHAAAEHGDGDAKVAVQLLQLHLGCPLAAAVPAPSTQRLQRTAAWLHSIKAGAPSALQASRKDGQVWHKKVQICRDGRGEGSQEEEFQLPAQPWLPGWSSSSSQAQSRAALAQA